MVECDDMEGCTRSFAPKAWLLVRLKCNRIYHPWLKCIMNVLHSPVLTGEPSKSQTSPRRINTIARRQLPDTCYPLKLRPQLAWQPPLPCFRLHFQTPQGIRASPSQRGAPRSQ